MDSECFFGKRFKTKDALHTVLITTYGLKRNLYSDTIYATVTMDGLFAELTPST